MQIFRLKGASTNTWLHSFEHGNLHFDQDLHHYEEIYFWDTDYLFLDEFTETELKGSAVSEFIGIDNIEDKSRKFEIPAGWLR